MGRTDIEWASDSLNPVRGCWPKSAGCAKCYAMRLAATRLRHTPKYKGLATYIGVPRWTGEVQLDIDVMREVLTWHKPRDCFLCDMSDLFYEKVPFEFIDDVFAFVANAPDHRFYVPTKRAERMRDYFASYGRGGVANGMNIKGATFRLGLRDSFRWPPPNLWLGVSVEDQGSADARIPELLSTPCAGVKFVSYEPALGKVDFNPPTCPNGCDERWGRDFGPGSDGATPFCNNCDSEMAFGSWLDPLNGGIGWVIAGGESGPGARPMSDGWMRAARDECRAAGVPFFFKQKLEGGKKISLPQLDGRYYAETPHDTAVERGRVDG